MKIETEKPLFIPLKWPHYWAFANNSKRIEYRTYGPRWNEKTCRIGRKVTLSCGYGKKSRLSGIIMGFWNHPKNFVQMYDDLTPEERSTLQGMSGPFACIEIGGINPITT